MRNRKRQSRIRRPTVPAYCNIRIFGRYGSSQEAQMNSVFVYALAVGFCGTVAYGTEPSSGDPNIALAQLVKGNERYVSGKVSHPDQSLKRRADLKTGQK